MRTFGQSLRTLAERLPKEFHSGQTGRMFAWKKDTNGNWILHWWRELTQDDLDDILAVVKKRMLLTPSGSDNEKKWDLCYEIYDLDWSLEFGGHSGEQEKRPAAQIGLIAVVENLFPEEGEPTRVIDK